jgi:carbon-monoxide dehydrogenase medium subunit
MKPPPFDYARPATLAEAVRLRGEHGDESVILAGGQSLLPLLNFRLSRPGLVIDLGGIRELAYVEERDGGVAVGAMTRQRDLELHEGAARCNPLIRETLGHVAHTVVRNRGTVVGSVAHADASGELPTLFATVGGVATAASTEGERQVTGEDLFAFHLTNSLEPGELLREVWFPALRPDDGHAYVEFARRHGDYALCGVCATLRVGDDGAIAAARLGFSGVTTRPRRCRAAEEALLGRAAGDEAFASAAATAAADVVDVADDYAADREYRQHLVRRLTHEALQRAHARALNRRTA